MGADTELHRERNQLGERLNSDLFHHVMAVRFDRTLGDLQVVTDLFVQLSLDESSNTSRSRSVKVSTSASMAPS